MYDLKISFITRINDINQLFQKFVDLADIPEKEKEDAIDSFSFQLERISAQSVIRDMIESMEKIERDHQHIRDFFISKGLEFV